MMEKILFRILLPGLALFFLAACSGGDKSCGEGEEIIEIDRVSLTLGESTASLQPGSRAVSGFVVNTAADPTYDFTQKLDWTLYLRIYKGSAPYAEGTGYFEWDGQYWTSTGIDPIYMPSYRIQYVTADLYPASWSGVIDTDQKDVDTFIEQDILVQNGTPTYQTVPAHYLDVKMRHSHSMIDFVLANVNPDDIASVTVDAGGDTYEPYKVPVTGREEYLVILPTGIATPVIRVVTKAGARYSKELAITATAINTCYYVRLTGLELLLQSINVSDWTTGEAVEGEFTSPTSYPTFRGPVETSVTVYYSSDVSQSMTFNEKGEALEPPAGRTIVAVQTTDGRYVLPQPYTIRTMIVDLNPYILAITAP